MEPLMCPVCGTAIPEEYDTWCPFCTEDTSCSEGFLRAFLRSVRRMEPDPDEVNSLVTEWLREPDNLTIFEWVVQRGV